jgi:hypothetical protein
MIWEASKTSGSELKLMWGGVLYRMHDWVLEPYHVKSCDPVFILACSKWEVLMICLCRSCPPCSCSCWAGAESLLLPEWCSPYTMISWRCYWCSGAECHVTGWSCALPQLTCLDDQNRHASVISAACLPCVDLTMFTGYAVYSQCLQA